jgi:hypothetical protein
MLRNVNPHYPRPFHLDHYFTPCVGCVINPVFVPVEFGLDWSWRCQKVSLISDYTSVFELALSQFSLADLIEKTGLSV